MKLLVLSDIHVPYEDKKAVSAALEFARKRKVKDVVLLGDIGDFHPVSRFDKDPNTSTLKQEIEALDGFLTRLQSRFNIVAWMDGNHEERLRSYISKNAEQLKWIDAIKVPGLLRLDERGIPYYTYNEPFQPHPLLVLVHGHRYGKTAAKNNLMEYGLSGASGHSHRQSMWVTNRGGGHIWDIKGHKELLLPRIRVDMETHLTWVEAGHFADVEQIDYVQGKGDWMNWQQGGLLLDIDDSGSEAIFEPFRIVNGKIHLP